MTVAGVDLGGSKIAGVLLDESGTVRGELWQEHRIQGPEQAVELIGEVVGELMAREQAAAGNAAAGSRRELRSVGLAVAGWLSRDRQDVRSAVNLGITATPLARLAQARLNCPVIVENDGNAAAYAEFTRGAGQQARVLMLITLGTGVGGGIVSSGTLVQGSHGLAGELGHIPVEGESVTLTQFDPDSAPDHPVRWQATVERMDGRRIDLITLVPLPLEEESTNG